MCLLIKARQLLLRCPRPHL